MKPLVKQYSQRLLSLCLALIMCLNMINITAIAAEKTAAEQYAELHAYASTLREEEYTLESWSVFNETWSALKDLGTDISEMSEAVQQNFVNKLQEAIDSLVKSDDENQKPDEDEDNKPVDPETNYAKYLKLIEYAENLDSTLYTEKSWEAFQKKLERVYSYYLPKAEEEYKQGNDISYGYYNGNLESDLKLLYFKDTKSVTLTHKDTGIQILSNNYDLAEGAWIDVTIYNYANWPYNLEGSWQCNIPNISAIYSAYKITVRNADNQPADVARGYQLTVPVPDEYDLDNLNVVITQKNGSQYKPNHEIDTQNRLLKIYFENWNADIANEGVIFFSNPIHTIDVSALGDGVYRVNVNLVKHSDAGVSSMADGTLDKTAVLVKNNNNAELYMSFVPIDYLGGLSYTGGLWCEIGEKADGRFDESSMTVLSYYCNEDGSLMDNEIYDAITEIGCVKLIKLSLNDECKNEAGGYTLVVSSPVMAAMNGMAFEEIIADDLLVNLMISNPEHLGSVEYAREQIPVYDKSALLKEIKYAEIFSEKEYTANSYQMLAKTIEAAEKIYESTYSDTATASAAYEEQIRLLKTAVANLEESTELTNAKEALQKVIDTAKAVLIGNKTESAYAKLQNAITAAENIYNNTSLSVSDIETAKTSLEQAITDFHNSKEASELDKNNLKNGIYSIHVDMMKTDRVSKSMADNAINHTVKLEVINGEYYVTLDFRGITIENRFGYLKNLAYYADGYTYGQYGTVEGTHIPAEVLSTQKDSDGKDIIDQYNDTSSLYPDIVKIRLVASAIADEEGYVPLHVFVPIMEAIAAGNGNQDVLMKIDWTTLKEATEDTPEFQPEKPVEQSPAVDAADSATDIKAYAEPGVFENGVKLIVNIITSGEDYEKAAAALAEIGKKFKLYEIHFEDVNSQEVQPNGTVKVSFPITAGYDATKTVLYRINEDGSKTLIKGEVEGDYYTVITKSFSLYALVEKDSVVTNEQNIVSESNSLTGDYTNSMYWFLMMVSSAGILGVTMMIRKRKTLIGE